MLNKCDRRWLYIVAPLLLVFMGILVGFVLAEVGFRTYKLSKPSSFRLAASAYGQFDEQFGQQFVPHSKNVLSQITNGRVVWCYGIVASANADGLGGRSTLTDAQDADYVILTTGDSFSHWKRSDLTVPDAVESLLNTRTDRKIVNLNFARGGYGILQMLTMAAGMYPAVKPDLIVIQFISDDLTRGRWWTRESVIDSRKRAQRSSHPNGFEDPRLTSDEVIVDEQATEEWCQRQLTESSPDGVVKAATNYYHTYLRARGVAVEPFSFTKSYLIDALWMKFFDRPFYTDSSVRFIQPRVTLEDFLTDQSYHEAIQKLKSFGVPIVLIHLPRKAEILAGNPMLLQDEARIWTYLEKDLDTRIVTFSTLPNVPVVPQTIDLEPHDGHPNLDGIMFYGEYVTMAIQRYVSAETRPSLQRIPVRHSGSSQPGNP